MRMQRGVRVELGGDESQVSSVCGRNQCFVVIMLSMTATVLLLPHKYGTYN